MSVIIPCYNGERFLRETINSTLSQTRPALEVIVIDDGSTDGSAEIAESYGGPVRVIRQENQGESVARNRGIDEARGEWIAFLDADDVWKPEKTEKQLAAAGDGVVAVHTNIYHFGVRSAVTRLQDIPESTRYSLRRICTACPFHTPSSFIVARRACPRFPEWTRYGEEYAFYVDLVMSGRIVLVEEPLTGYRRHAACQSADSLMSLKWHETVQRCIELRRERFDEVTVAGIQADWLERLASLARQAKYQRKWNEYWALRQYLRSYADAPDITAVVRERIYPRWIYTCKDRLESACAVLRRA